jgi:organic radical activating enzyme
MAMKKYNIVEIFNSIQGEGSDTGKLVTFVRFAGCNLSCSFCDTDFSQGTLMDEKEIISKCLRHVVFTGGEPLAQDIYPLARALWNKHDLSLETNGTIALTDEHQCLYSSISMSPKVPVDKCKLKYCDSLKILFPYLPEITAASYAGFETDYKSLQVIDPVLPEGIPHVARIADAIVELRRLESIGLHDWRLGLQLHKFIGVK